MDQKKPVKRARSLTPTKVEGGSFEATPTKKRKTSKKKEKKNKGFSNGGSATESNADQDNADAPQPPEEMMMAQMLSTFSNVEQARFAAYTRSKLPTSAVEDLITAILRDRLGQPDETTLAEMVSTDQANDICWTISMAAKIFAQRLVSEALKQYPDETPGPSPEAVCRVAQDRIDDSGLFLQPHPASKLHWSSTAVSAHQQALLAAEQAQEDYDKEQQARSSGDGNEDEKPQPMETES